MVGEHLQRRRQDPLAGALAAPDDIMVTTALVVTESAVGGTMDLLRQPPYLATILGTAKLLPVPALLVPGLPRIREWAFAGIVLTMPGAAASHLAARDDPVNLVALLAFAGLAFASRAFSGSGSAGA